MKHIVRDKLIFQHPLSNRILANHFWWPIELALLSILRYLVVQVFNKLSYTTTIIVYM